MSKRNQNLAPPDDLNAEELAEWSKMIELAKASKRIFKPCDVPILAAYCKAAVTLRVCWAKVRQDGPTTTYQGRPVQNPAFKAARELSVLVRQLLADLGCSPASRQFDVKEQKPKRLAPLVF